MNDRTNKRTKTIAFHSYELNPNENQTHVIEFSDPIGIYFKPISTWRIQLLGYWHTSNSGHLSSRKKSSVCHLPHSRRGASPG